MTTKCDDSIDIKIGPNPLNNGYLSNFQGRFYKLTNAICQPPPVQQPKPPILIGGHGETHLMRVLASHGEISNKQSDMPVAEHRRKRTILQR